MHSRCLGVHREKDKHSCGPSPSGRPFPFVEPQDLWVAWLGGFSGIKGQRNAECMVRPVGRWLGSAQVTSMVSLPLHPMKVLN